MLKEQKKLNEAIAAYRKAIQLDPKNVEGRVNLGAALAEQNKWDEAITTARQLLNAPNESYGSTTTHVIAHTLLGAILAKQGKLEAGIQAFEQAIKLDPNLDLPQNSLREAKRLQIPQSPPEDDGKYLPSLEPKLPVLRATARITAKTSDGSPIVAAGWVVKRQGDTIWIVTNRHAVIDEKTKQPVEEPIEAEFYSELPPNKSRYRYTAKIVQVTPNQEDLDLAVLQVSNPRLPKDIQPLLWNLDRLRVNQRVYVIGHPHIKGDWDSASGDISRFNANETVFSIDATVARGNSGGPVINEQNQVIGVFFKIRDRNNAVSIAANREMPNLEILGSATGDVGLAYRIEVVIQKLKAWKILD